MILIPPNALSIWHCTLSTSDSGILAFFGVRKLAPEVPLSEPDPRELMRPFPADLMRMWPISTRVNKPE
jgi:hypothetical protein